MREIPDKLIILKGKDKTNDVSDFEYIDDEIKVRIKFNDGSIYEYNAANVQIYENKKVTILKNKILFLNGSVLLNAYAIQSFGEYVRIIYDDYTFMTVNADYVAVLDNKTCKGRDRFDYFKEIAQKTGLFKDGKNILLENYNTIKTIDKNSVLFKYLENGEVTSIQRNNKTVIYPFGFNLSQKQAVENALKNQISIIEGPPGTGKTQTILNIIANTVMQGNTVAVISNNNTATKNIYEKLEKYNLSFIAAQLGNSDNKKDFLETQNIEIPEIEEWKKETEKLKETEEALDAAEVEFNQMLDVQNSLAILKAKLDELEREFEHYSGYINNDNVDLLTVKFFKKVKTEKILTFITEYEHITENNINISFFKKLIWRINYGIKSFDFLNEDAQNIINCCENLFYNKRINEIKNNITKLEKQLQSYDFSNKMNDYTAKSMMIFKGNLAKEYTGGKHKRLYERKDLKWKSEAFTKDYPVILSTTYSLRSSLNNSFVYDYVIVDEASQVDIATGVLALSCAKNAVIVGDLKQLPNVIDSETRNKTTNILYKYGMPDLYNYAKHSLLSSVISVFKDAPKVLLKEHYRCNPAIIGFCNKRFYNNELVIMTENNSISDPLKVYRTVAGNHARNHINQRQIDVIMQEVLPSLTTGNGENIGIVTPYRNQADLMKKTFDKFNETIKSDTVDKFQGQERTTMIFSTVDNEISDFVSDPNRLNVAVSRAIKQFIVVTDGNNNDNVSPIHDLIGYIKYYNYDVIDSNVQSIFDNLYKGYEEAREQIIKKYGRQSEFESENLMYSLIEELLEEDKYSKLSVAMHIPLKYLIRDYSKLEPVEITFASNRLTHLDFVVFSKLNYQPLLVIEVDGYAYHNVNQRQQKRDKMKNEILEKYGIPIERFNTTGSNEKQRLKNTLDTII